MIKEERLEKIKRVLNYKQPTLQIFLEDVHDPHNISAVMRSADAVGVLNFYFSRKNNEKVNISQNVTQGSYKWLFPKKINYEDRIEFIKSKKKEGFRVYTTYLDDSSINFREANFKEPSLIVLGNEKDGVSKELLKEADQNIIIPMYGMSQSLNVSVAAAVILYEAQRQREEAGFYDQVQLSKNEYEKILKEWLFREIMLKKSRGRASYNTLESSFEEILKEYEL